MDIYLNDILKDYYSNDFKNVLAIKDDFWRLDKEAIPYLIEINNSTHFRTLYSKYFKKLSPNDKTSYVHLTFTKKGEKILLREIIPYLIIYLKESEDLFGYTYNLPEKKNVTNAFDMGYFTNPDYFNVNNIRLCLESFNNDSHIKFWKKLIELIKDNDSSFSH